MSSIRAWVRWLRAALRALVAAVAPTVCGACRAPGPSPCGTCLAALRRPPPVPPPPGLDALVPLLAYDGPARDLVARIKYRNARAVVPWLATELARRIDRADVDCVTWVPTTARRRRGRGFDHAHLLARAVAARLDRPCVGLLHRGPGPPQTGRSAGERRRGPALRPTGRARAAAGARILVVDDVCTSGATLSAAARVLRDAGARSVSGAVAARTLRAGMCGRPLKVVIRGTDPPCR
jgi:predicted amidophosphoribosyltransferase